jgi:hypothetical protein
MALPAAATRRPTFVARNRASVAKEVKAMTDTGSTTLDPRFALLLELFANGVFDLEQTHGWAFELGLGQSLTRRLMNRCVALRFGEGTGATAS